MEASPGLLEILVEIGVDAQQPAAFRKKLKNILPSTSLENVWSEIMDPDELNSYNNLSRL